MPSDNVSREVVKAAIEDKLRFHRDCLEKLKSRHSVHDSHVYHIEGIVNGLELANAAVDALPAASDERWEKLLHNLRVRRDELHRNYPFTIEEGVLERIIVEMEGAAPPAKWVDLLATKQAEIGRLTRENNQLKQAFDAYHSGSIQTRWNPQGFWWCVPNDIKCHGPHQTGREAALAAIAQLKETPNAQ